LPRAENTAILLKRNKVQKLGEMKKMVIKF